MRPFTGGEHGREHPQGAGGDPSRPPATPRSLLGKLAPPSFGFESILTSAFEGLSGTTPFPKIVAVCAAVGYGKTVLLSQLYRHLRSRKGRTLWVTLDDRDADLESLLALLGAGLAAHKLSTIVGEASPGDTHRRADALIRAMDGAGRLTIFIDNLNFCVDPRLERFLDDLVFASGPQLRLVVSSSSSLALDVTLAKLKFPVVEVDTVHLRFDRSRAGELFARSGTPLSADSLDVALAQTEGWPAALRLLQVVVKAEGPGAGPARLEPDGRDITAVLTRRLLAGFAPEVVDFLMQIACLREFSAELAEAVTGQPLAGQWMEMLVARNVLVFRIDGSRHWLRMHTLLRQFLQAEAQRKLGASNQRAVCKAAATYFAEHGEAVTAIDYALEGSALELASTLLDRIARKVPTGRDWRSRYLAWAEHLMAAGMPLSLTAHSWYAWALCFSNAHERARWSTERLLERLALEEDVPHELQTRAGLLQVLNAVFLDRVEEARCAATSWLAEDRPRDAFDRAMVAGASVIAALARRDDDGACQSLLVAQSAVASRPDSYGHVWVMILTACQHLDAGEPRQADALLRPVRDTALRNFGPEADVIDTLDLVHARVALDLGDVAAARERVLRGMASATRHGIIETVLHGLATCVVLAELPDSPPALRPAAQDAVAMTYPPRARRLLAAMRVRLLACGGKLDEAHVLGRRAGLWVQARRHADLDREGIGVTLAQLELLAHEQPAKALVWIDKLTREAPMRYLVRESVALYLLSASIHQRAGEARRALRQFSLALVLAARRGLLSPFDERPGLIAFLFAKFAVRDFGFTHPDEIDLLEQLSERWGLVGGASAQQIGGESLTPRERDLLDMLACGLSNQQIADRLALSVTTVKWHCSNLYGKLGVRSRSAAVTRARHQGQLRDAA